MSTRRDLRSKETDEPKLSIHHVHAYHLMPYTQTLHTHMHTQPVSHSENIFGLGFVLGESFLRPLSEAKGAAWKGRAFELELRVPWIWKVNHKMKIIREHQCTRLFMCVCDCVHVNVYDYVSVCVGNGALTSTHRSCSALWVGIFFKKIKPYFFFPFPFSKTKQFTDAESFF